MDTHALTQFGLTRNEATVYLALLESGECKAGHIIKKANFRSGKIYDVLNSLIDKGLVSYVDKNKIKFFSAQSPTKIKDFIQQKKARIIEQESQFKTQLPALLALFNEKKDACEVKTFEGIEGARSALDILLAQIPRHATISIFGANDDPARDIILLWRRYEEICIQRKVHTRVIMSQLSTQGRNLRKHKKNPHKSYRFLAGKDVSNLMIGGDIILIYDFSKPNCVLIKNATHAEQFKELFEILWTKAEKL